MPLSVSRDWNASSTYIDRQTNRQNSKFQKWLAPLQLFFFVNTPLIYLFTDLLSVWFVHMNHLSLISYWRLYERQHSYRHQMFLVWAKDQTGAWYVVKFLCVHECKTYIVVKVEDRCFEKKKTLSGTEQKEKSTSPFILLKTDHQTAVNCQPSLYCAYSSITYAVRTAAERLCKMNK